MQTTSISKAAIIDEVIIDEFEEYDFIVTLKSNEEKIYAKFYIGFFEESDKFAESFEEFKGKTFLDVEERLNANIGVMSYDRNSTAYSF